MKVIDNRSSIYADSFSIKVGDTIRISDGKEVPADVIIINSSNPEGNCFIQTSSLDGEKNLKKRCVSKGLKLHDTIFIQGLIECDPPNSELYEFRGQLTLENDPKRYVLNENQLLIKGSKLMNTEWIIGIVVYSGLDTKLM